MDALVEMLNKKCCFRGLMHKGRTLMMHEYKKIPWTVEDILSNRNYCMEITADEQPLQCYCSECDKFFSKMDVANIHILDKFDKFEAKYGTIQNAKPNAELLNLLTTMETNRIEQQKTMMHYMVNMLEGLEAINHNICHLIDVISKPPEPASGSATITNVADPKAVAIVGSSDAGSGES